MQKMQEIRLIWGGWALTMLALWSWGVFQQPYLDSLKNKNLNLSNKEKRWNGMIQARFMKLGGEKRGYWLGVWKCRVKMRLTFWNSGSYGMIVFYGSLKGITVWLLMVELGSWRLNWREKKKEEIEEMEVFQKSIKVKVWRWWVVFKIVLIEFEWVLALLLSWIWSESPLSLSLELVEGKGKRRETLNFCFKLGNNSPFSLARLWLWWRWWWFICKAIFALLANCSSLSPLSLSH